MSKYILKRILLIFVTLFIVSTITFFLMHSIPGGPFTGEENLPPEIVDALNEKYKLNDPLRVQYVDYMKGLITFKMGPSFKKVGVNVEDIIRQGFPVSAKVGVFAGIVIIILGVPFGVISALKKGKWQDYLLTIFGTVGISIPSFVLGSLMIYIFGAKLEWIPTYGLSTWKHYIGPIISLGVFSLAFIMRLTRSSMLEVLQQDYITTALARGVPKSKIIYKHALKNALIPVVTYMGPMIASLLTGSFVIEKIFAINGMGKHFVDAINNRDYTVIMGTTFFFAAFTAVMIFVVDIAYGLIDPRIKIDE